jgi:repressor LexA
MPEALTDRQKTILDFIARRSRETGVPPSLREIAAHFSITAGGLQKQIRALLAKGALRRLKSRIARGLQVVAEIGLPILGRVPAGPPAEAVEDIEGRMDLGRALQADYLLRVKGESMFPEIAEGDLVMVRQASAAEDGEIVIARVGEDEATLKRLRRRGGKAWLEAANPAFKPVRGAFKVVGRVVGLVRDYARRRGG